MKKILGLAALLAVAVAPVYGASTITYGLQLEGNNHAAEWAAGTVVPYTPGSTADGQNLANDAVIDWAVTVAVTGDSFGAANLVFNLELWKDGALVAVGAGSPSTPGFFSTINDGDQDAGQASADPLALAAFAFGVNVGEPTLGRLFDPTPAGSPSGVHGPNMSQATLPSAAGYPANSTAPLGTLVGMGAGYTKLDGNETVGLLERVGVGFDAAGTVPNDICAGLGMGPIAEGQINLTGMPGGTYTLKVVPGNGNNVVKSGVFFCDAGTTGNFAVKADVTQGDEISFVLAPPAVTCSTVPALASAVSRRTHGAAGDFDVALPLTGSVGVEGRQNGPTLMVLTYSAAVMGTPTASAGTATLVNDTTVTVALPNAVDGSCVSVTVSGLKCKADGSTTVPAATVKARYLLGDTIGAIATPAVTSNDVAFAKSKSGLAVDATNFRADVIANGTLNSNDVAIVKSRSGVTTPAACTQ